MVTEEEKSAAEGGEPLLEEVGGVGGALTELHQDDGPGFEDVCLRVSCGERNGREEDETDMILAGKIFQAIIRGGRGKDNSYLEELLLLPKVNVNQISEGEFGRITWLHWCILYYNVRGLEMFLDHPKMSASTVNMEMFIRAE